jgi:hypothetical protein
LDTDEMVIINLGEKNKETKGKAGRPNLKVRSTNAEEDDAATKQVRTFECV